MSDSDEMIRHETPTRREYVKCGGAVVGGGLLAGCIGEGGPGDDSTATEATG